MANLPNNTFVFNFNARDYVDSTRTIPNHSAGTLSQDMVLQKTSNFDYRNVSSAITVSDDHITFAGGMYAQFAYNQASDSPFNITSSEPNLTIVFKMWRDPETSVTPGTSNAQSDILSNRGRNALTFNWLARCDAEKFYFHSTTTNANPPSGVTWSAKPLTMLYRVTNGVVEVKNLTEGLSNTPFSTTFNDGTNRLTFFGQGYQSVVTDIRNCVGGDFYWAYLSRESLTDAEVQQVVQFNDGSLVSLDKDSLTFESTGGSDTVSVTAGDDWSASTSDNWITLSSVSGTSGTTTVTVTAPDYQDTTSARTGSVTFTCSGDSVTLSVRQKKVSTGVNGLFLGSLRLEGVYLGSQALEAVYLGANLIYAPGSPSGPTGDPLTFSVTSAGNIYWTDSYGREIQYSKNGGAWTTISGNTTISVVSGDTVQFKGTNNSYSGTSSFNGTDCGYYLSGNIMSLVYGDDYIVSGDTIPSADCFVGMFAYSIGLTSSANLELPATNLTARCYKSLFEGCTAMTDSPQLQATTLAEGCYQDMFSACDSLVDAPALPATTLAPYCYYGMFEYDHALATAPDLPATALTTGCYYQMFRECTSLSYIKCLAEDISATDCTFNWVENVPSSGGGDNSSESSSSSSSSSGSDAPIEGSGTFVKSASMYDWSFGISGIPDGWDVEDA